MTSFHEIKRRVSSALPEYSNQADKFWNRLEEQAKLQPPKAEITADTIRHHLRVLLTDLTRGHKKNSAVHSKISQGILKVQYSFQNSELDF